MLHASVAIRCALRDDSAADRAYADRVLHSLVESSAHVPVLWHTELVHVLRCAEDDAKIGESAIASYFARLNRLPIETDPTAPRALSPSVASVSREYKLSGYDAQYLELALRLQLPVATLDRKLRKSAVKAGLPLWLV
ncbi:MAG: type II toxin-antitoxin system VapC family toxin [Casimicrobium sp.]